MKKNYKKVILLVSSALISTNLNALDLNGKSYPIKSVYSGNCINVEGNSTEQGSKIVQYPCKEDGSQKFTFSKDTNGNYTVSTPQGKKIAIASNSKSNGVNIVQEDTGSLFAIEEVNGGYKLQNINSDKYLSIETTSSDIVQYYGNKSDKQIWKIGEQYPNLVPYYETTYSITEVNVYDITYQANLASSLKNLKETWANDSLMFHGAKNVKPYAILDAGENKKFKIGNLRTSYINNGTPTDSTNTFDILISDDGINYTLLYRSNYSYPLFNIEHKMNGEARFIKFEITDIGNNGYSRIFFDTNFPFWDLYIFDDI